MTAKKKLLFGFALFTPLLTVSYFYTQAVLVPRSEIKLCDEKSYKKEKLEVQRIVRERIEAIKAGENLPLLLPVEFIFTTGDRHDADSYLSYLRSIMRANDDGETIIQTSDDRLSYLTDHSIARKQFLSGSRKYFSVVEVKSLNTDEAAITYSSFKKLNKFSALDPLNIFRAHAESGLKGVRYDYVSHFELTGEIGIAQIILADIRNPIAPHIKGVPFMKLVKQRNEMMATFSRDRMVNGFSYSPYEGMPRMIERFKCESTSTILTSFRITQGQELHAETVPTP